MTRVIFAGKEIQNRFRPRKTSKKQRNQRTRRAISRRRCRRTHERRRSCADFGPPRAHNRHMGRSRQLGISTSASAEQGARPATSPPVSFFSAVLGLAADPAVGTGRPFRLEFEPLLIQLVTNKKLAEQVSGYRLLTSHPAQEAEKFAFRK